MGECATLLSYQSPQLSSFLALDVLEAVKDLLVVLRGTPRGEPGAGELLNELFNRAEVGPAASRCQGGGLQERTGQASAALPIALSLSLSLSRACAYFLVVERAQGQDVVSPRRGNQSI